MQALFEGRIRNVARWYGGVSTSYAITPLLKLVANGILNFDDLSGLLWPSFEYSASSSVYVVGGLQLFGGGARSEYGRVRDVLHLQVKWFF